MPGRLGILVGPGVPAAGAAALAGLRDLADATGSGVVNTWGAKGVFRWDDPRHHGTAGLQALDFDLAGLGDVDVLLTSGLDPDEVTSRPWEGRSEVRDVPPGRLADVARRAADELPAGRLDRPALYTELAAVVGPMYGSSARPPPAPARAAALAAALPPGGLVVAEPGLVGFWVARTFPTAEPGSVAVPARGGPQAAWATASEAARAGRAVVLVAAAPVDADTGPVQVEVWDRATTDLDPAALVAVAGDIVAWR